MKKMTFALCFCNRGFMPGELIYGAREQDLLYAKWLKEHEGQYDGVMFSMPIFDDENGVITALQNAGVPILMQAYPVEIGKMDFKHRK